MTEFQPGDRVSIEGTVKRTEWTKLGDNPGQSLLYVALDPDANATLCVSPSWATLTLVSRPAPPLPTEPGTTGYATVRGVPGVRVMRGRYWFSAVLVSGNLVHCDDDLRDFIPDPDTTTICEDSGYTRYVCQATDICDCFEPRVVPDPQPVPAQDDTSAAPLYAPNGLKTLHEDLCRAQTAVGQFYTDDRTWGTVKRLQSLIDQIEVYRPLGSNGKHGNLHTSYCGCDADPTPATPQPAPEPPCECGHGRGDHGPGLTDCRAVKGCPCTAYRPAALEPACTCTRDTSGHIVSLDPTCPARDADPTPKPWSRLCECGHGPKYHYSGGCSWGSCACLRGPYRPATEPSTNTGKPSITTRDTNAYPTGLVARVERATTDPGTPAGLTSAAHRAALAVADWIEQRPGLGATERRIMAALIRREVEDGAS